MATIGVRCSNSDFTYAVLDGLKNAPRVLALETISYPKGFSSAQSLKWLFQEVQDLLKRHVIGKVVIKRFEGRVRGNSFEERVEHEAAVILAAADSGLKSVTKKVKSTIAKDLGQKGRARYLGRLDTSFCADFRNLSDKKKEAIQSAWSELD